MTDDMKIKKRLSGAGLGNKTRRGIRAVTEARDFSERRDDTSLQSGNGTSRIAGLAAERIAAYARVSTQRQETDDTIASQLDAIASFLASNRQNVSAERVYTDAGYSGASLTRPALDKLRDAVALGQYDAVIVYDPDRLARNYVYQMLLVEEFEKQGCVLEFVRCPIGRTPDEKLLLQMQGVIAEYERAKITERTRRGKLHKMRQGEMIVACRTFGYNYVPRTKDVPPHFSVIDAEADVVRQIFAWYIHDGLPVRQIAARLTDKGVPTVKGGKWNPSTLCSMLKNPVYSGTGYTHKFEVVAPKQKNRPNVYRQYDKSSNRRRAKEEWIPFSAPAIIDEETFELAQQRLESNKTLAARRTQREYLLRGLIFCSKCGRRMQISGRTLSYRCPSQTPCDNRVNFPVRLLDDHVWNEVMKTLKKPANLRKHYQKHAGKIVPRATQGKERLEKKAADLNDRLRRLNNLFVEGFIPKPDYVAQHKILTDKLHLVQSQLRKSQADCLGEDELRGMLSSFSRFSETVKRQIKEADFATKRFIVEQLVKRVIVSEKDVTIELSAPLSKNILCTHGVKC